MPAVSAVPPVRPLPKIEVCRESARRGSQPLYGHSMSSAPLPVPVVAVRGEWHGEVQPELAQVFVTVGARGDDRSRILAQVSARVEELREIVDGYGEAVERVDTSALQVVATFKERKPTEKATGYLATVRLSVHVVDFTILGDLLLRLADEAMVTLDGPYWALRPESSVHRRARTEAVRDARTRAEEYAAAAGSRLTGLVEISDVGLSRRFGDGFIEQAEPAEMRARGSVADRVTFDVQPVPQTVYASVEARFTLSQPEFS